MKTNIIKRIGLLAGLFLAIVLFAIPAQAQNDDNIIAILKSTYGWGAPLGFPNTAGPCNGDGDPWNGITCDGAKLIGLDAACGVNKLSAPFPQIVFALTSMEDFGLRACYPNGIQAINFSGACDGGLVCGHRTPNFYGFYNFTRLKRFRLDTGNVINGTIDELFRKNATAPYQSGLDPTNFPGFELLYLSDSKMSGQIPAGIMQFTSATDIRLNHASFSGELPATGNSSKNIWLNGNKLEGVLPDYIRNADLSSTVYLRYNKFDVENTPAGNIDLIDPLWRSTQTVPPTGVQARPLGGNAAELTWTPIAYQAHGGYYEVLSSTDPNGPFTSRGTTADSGGKTASSLIVSNLPDGVNYFIVRTFTPAHTGVLPEGCTQEVDCVTENNPNDLTSKNSVAVQADVSYIPASTSWNIALQSSSVSNGNPINIVVTDLLDQFNNFIPQILTVKVLNGSNVAANQNFSVTSKPSTLSINNLSPGNYTVEVYAGNTKLKSFNAAITTTYNFTGFFQPVSNLPAINLVSAGSAVPLKFSLGGNFGLNIFAAGYPNSAPIACDAGEAGSTVSETVSAGGSSLSYDATTDQYSYVWKTEKAWKNSCRLLTVKLNDGSQYSAKFRFK